MRQLDKNVTALIINYWNCTFKDQSGDFWQLFLVYPLTKLLQLTDQKSTKMAICNHNLTYTQLIY